MLNFWVWQVCSGTGVLIPTGVISVPKTYSIDFLSTPDEEAEPMETTLRAGLDGDNFTDYTLQQGTSGFAAMHGNYTFEGAPRQLTQQFCLAAAIDRMQEHERT